MLHLEQSAYIRSHSTTPTGVEDASPSSPCSFVKAISEAVSFSSPGNCTALRAIISKPHINVNQKL
jgi:hypothetical protein